MHPGITIHRFESALLERNPLGDAPVRQVPVWLPPSGGRDLPLLVMLSAFTKSGPLELAGDWYRESLPERLTRLHGAGTLPDCCVLMVDSMTVLGGNQFVDSPAVGPWARHVVEELVPWARATLPVADDAARTGVFGHSSGGYGALRLAMDHPGVFGGVAASAPDGAFAQTHALEFPAAALGLEEAGGVEAFLADLRARRWPLFPGRLFPTLGVVALAHFYSPDPDEPAGIALPFDGRTGALREHVFARWLAHDPVERVANHAAALRDLRHLWIEAGQRDEYHHQLVARRLVDALAASDVPHQLEVHEGGHRKVGYRLDAFLPPLVGALSG